MPTFASYISIAIGESLLRSCCQYLETFVYIYRTAHCSVLCCHCTLAWFSPFNS